MNPILEYAFAALPFVVVALLAVLSVAGIGVGLVQPRFLAYVYLAIFFMFNSSNYGNLRMMLGASIYGRGSGLLVFPLLLWYLLGAWCCARAAAGFSRRPRPACNLMPWFWGWAALLAAHAMAGIFLGVKLRAALAPSGFSYIVWMAPLISLLLLSFRTREHIAELARFVMLAGLVRAVFGLGRWAFAGGDPNNIYANINAVPIRLTFFDINDSLLCTLALTIAALRLARSGTAAVPRWWRGVEWATVCATTACIMLSYRRTAWAGLLLALAVIAFRLPLLRRVQLLALGLPAAGAAVLLLAVQRLSHTRGLHGGGIGSFFHDMGSRRFGAESERLLELKYALADFLANPLTGIGPWGRYSNFHRISWQGGPDGGAFIHSGVLHVALKSGLPGLILLSGLVIAFGMFAWRALRQLPPDLAGLTAAGVAGAAFMLPDFLIGTPVPQLRTTQMLAFCLALPYVAAGVASVMRTAPAATVPRYRAGALAPQ